MEKNEFEYIIIGAGPAGLQLGYYLEKAGRDYIILESDGAGAFFKTYPRHRKLISINKVHTGYNDTDINLRWDWNSLLSEDDEMLFRNFSKRYFPNADDMVRYLAAFAEHFRLKIATDVHVTRISRKDAAFQIEDQNGEIHTSQVLFMATGLSRPAHPDIPGIELADSYTDVTTDPEEFTNQRVLVIGKGNSGFETADNLVETAALIHLASPESIRMAWQSHFVGDLRAVNNNVLDTYQLKSQNALVDATVVRIRKQDAKYFVLYRYTHANDEEEELAYDRVIACTGFAWDVSIFDDPKPELTIENRLPKMTSCWESVNVPNLFFAGTIMQSRDYKKTTSGFIHGFRYNIHALHCILEKKRHSHELPQQSVRTRADDIAETIITRMNRSSALWQQFGFLGDVLVVPKNGMARYYQELPVDYVHESKLAEDQPYYVITLEYGDELFIKDPFSINRVNKHDVENSNKSCALHPIVRAYRNGEKTGEHHVIEDFANEWREEEHIRPLEQFFKTELEKSGTFASGD